MDLTPIYIVDIIKEIVQKTSTALFPTIGRNINFTYGPELLISKLLKDLTDAESTEKYPLFALIQPFDENRGSYDGYYTETTFPRIIIAEKTKSTDTPDVRYTQTFKPVLYPIYYEFLTQLARHKNNSGSASPDSIKHIKRDIPGTQPVTTDVKDFLDTIELYNLKVTFKQFCINELN